MSVLDRVLVSVIVCWKEEEERADIYNQDENGCLFSDIRVSSRCH